MLKQLKNIVLIGLLFLTIPLISYARVISCDIFKETVTKQHISLYYCFHDDYDSEETLKKESLEQVSILRPILKNSTQSSLLLLNESCFQSLPFDFEGIDYRFDLEDAILDLVGSGFRYHSFPPKVIIKQIDHRYYVPFFDYLSLYLENSDLNKYQNSIDITFKGVGILPGLSLEELHNPSLDSVFKAISFSFSHLKKYHEEAKKVFDISYDFNIATNASFGTKNISVIDSFNEFMERSKNQMEAAGLKSSIPFSQLLPEDHVIYKEFFEFLKVQVKAFGTPLVDLAILFEIGKSNHNKVAVFTGGLHAEFIKHILLAQSNWKRIKEYPLTKNGKKVERTLIQSLASDDDVRKMNFDNVDSESFNFLA